MAVPSVITDLSATAASNSPAGGDAVFPDLDNYLRAHASLIRYGDSKAANISSAATTDIGAAAGRVVDVTGTATITSLGTVSEGVWKIVRFTGACTLTHNATSLILPGGANITAAAGDCAIAVSLGSGNWVVTHYQRGGAVRASRFTAVGASSPSSSGYVTSYTETEDVGSNFDPSTGIFTAPQTGVYSFAFVVRGRVAADSQLSMTCELRRDGVSVGAVATSQWAHAISFLGAEEHDFTYSRAVYLSAGQEVQIYVTFSSGTSYTCQSFAGVYLGRGET